MDYEQQFVTTETALFYHADPDCFRLRGGRNAAPTNGWQQHDLIPWTPESGLKRSRCKECTNPH